MTRPSPTSVLASDSVTGRRFQAWIGEVRRRSAGPLQGLDAAEAAGIAGGDLLLEVSLSLAEGNEWAARSTQAQLRGALSPRSFDALFPDDAGAAPPVTTQKAREKPARMR